jgi:hypothetical protein
MFEKEVSVSNFFTILLKALEKVKNLTFTYMHVRITNKGRKVLNNKALASRVVDTIMSNKDALEKGATISVGESHLSIKFVTTMKDSV